MRILVVGDVHWSTYSSILRSRGDDCSTRLSNLLESVNWAEGLALERGCSEVVYLGDFFDKPDLTSEDISILQKVKWAEGIRHMFIVGNHESGLSDLKYSSTKVLEKHGFEVIDKPMVEGNKVFLPYSLSENLVDLQEVSKLIKRPIVFSHNDIKGIRYGAYESKLGYDIKDIERLGGLFINGHLHNHTKFMDGDGKLFAINLGNLTGQNFSEDAFVYKHYVMVLDDSDASFELVENPHALRFYKLDVYDDAGMSKLDSLGNNAVVCVKCPLSLKESVQAKLIGANALAIKIIVDMSSEQAERGQATIATRSDHLTMFRDFVLERLGTSDSVVSELKEICR